VNITLAYYRRLAFSVARKEKEGLLYEWLAVGGGGRFSVFRIDREGRRYPGFRTKKGEKTLFIWIVEREREGRGGRLISSDLVFSNYGALREKPADIVVLLKGGREGSQCGHREFGIEIEWNESFFCKGEGKESPQRARDDPLSTRYTSKKERRTLYRYCREGKGGGGEKEGVFLLGGSAHSLRRTVKKKKGGGNDVILVGGGIFAISMAH